MGKTLTFVDDLMAPTNTIKIKAKCKNPASIIGAAGKLLRDVMKITGKDVFELNVKWDATGENRTFYGIWSGKRKEDTWTTTVIRIIAQGEQTTTDLIGSVEVKIDGAITTKYNYTNFIDKSFWYLFSRIFYDKQRQAYLAFGKDNQLRMKEKIMKMYGNAPEGTF